MKSRVRRKPLRLVVEDGEPAAVILGIEEYRQLLEKLEDAEDLKMLERMRKKPLWFRKLKEFQAEYSTGYEVYLERAAERDLKQATPWRKSILAGKEGAN